MITPTNNHISRVMPILLQHVDTNCLSYLMIRDDDNHDDDT